MAPSIWPSIDTVGAHHMSYMASGIPLYAGYIHCRELLRGGAFDMAIENAPIRIHKVEIHVVMTA